MIPLPTISPADWSNAHYVWTQKIKGEIPLANDVLSDDVECYQNQTKEIMDYLGQIIAQDKGAAQVRAYGKNWSFSKSGATTGYLFRTYDSLKINILIDESYMDPKSRFKGKADHLLFVQCGNHLFDIHGTLAGLGLSLPVSGSSCDQTVAGAFSTGTHGSALNGGGAIADPSGKSWGGGAVHDYIRGLHLILGPNRHVFLQRAGDPVVTGDFGHLLGITNSSDFILSDDQFDAAVVSFGSFGFIHGVLLEAVDNFSLHATRNFHAAGFADLQDAMTGFNFKNVDPSLAGPQDLYHFEVFRNPQGTANQEAAVLLMNKLAYSTDYVNQRIPQNQTVNSDISWIGNAVNPTLGLMNSVFNTMYAPYDFYGTIGQVNPMIGYVGTGSVVLCIAFDMKYTMQVMGFSDKARAQFPGCFVWHDIRFIPKAKGLLAFQRAGQNCCFEIAGVGSQNIIGLINYFLAQLKAEKIPFAFHWGKYMPLDSNQTRYGALPTAPVNGLPPYVLDANELVRLYGNNVAQWKAQRAALFGNDKALMKLFTNDLMVSLGLDS